MLNSRVKCYRIILICVYTATLYQHAIELKTKQDVKSVDKCIYSGFCPENFKCL